MISLDLESNTLMTMKDLKAGDIALIEQNEKHIVYIFKDVAHEQLRAVSLTTKGFTWSDLDRNQLPVLKLFKSGDILTVA